MSGGCIEAFIWNYQNGEPIGFAFDTVRDIISTDDTDWSECGCLTARTNIRVIFWNNSAHQDLSILPVDCYINRRLQLEAERTNLRERRIARFDSGSSRVAAA